MSRTRYTPLSLPNKAIWADVADASAERKEHNDCAVRAVTIVTGLDYQTVHAAFIEAGRKPRKGTPRGVTREACKRLGYQWEPVQVRAKTAITAERDPVLRSGRFVVGMTRHLAAMVDGQLIDHTKGKRKRINGAYTLTPIAAVERQHVPIKPIAQTNTQMSLL